MLLCRPPGEGRLPKTLDWTDEFATKGGAKERAAMEGVRYLLKIGVLDAHFEIVGRAAALSQLRERASGRQGSTRANRRQLASS